MKCDRTHVKNTSEIAGIHVKRGKKPGRGKNRDSNRLKNQERKTPIYRHSAKKYFCGITIQ
jgi:hypothetical protein